jgi:hypothetical protein
MPDQNQPINLPPFLRGYRVSGLLLHITSLPSAYGIGDMRPAAFAWIDRLHSSTPERTITTRVVDGSRLCRGLEQGTCGAI